ncbi:MAG: DUF2065 domain-containing protein [Porticoccaceae bacterium]
MWQELAKALCLVLVLEGMMPFLSPAQWRHAMSRVAGMDDRSLRLIGLFSMLLGASLLFFVK